MQESSNTINDDSIQIGDPKPAEEESTRQESLNTSVVKQSSDNQLGNSMHNENENKLENSLIHYQKSQFSYIEEQNDNIEASLILSDNDGNNQSSVNLLQCDVADRNTTQQKSRVSSQSIDELGAENAGPGNRLDCQQPASDGACCGLSSAAAMRQTTLLNEQLISMTEIMKDLLIQRNELEEQVLQLSNVIEEQKKVITLTQKELQKSEARNQSLVFQQQEATHTSSNLPNKENRDLKEQIESLNKQLRLLAQQHEDEQRESEGQLREKQQRIAVLQRDNLRYQQQIAQATLQAQQEADQKAQKQRAEIEELLAQNKSLTAKQAELQNAIQLADEKYRLACSENSKNKELIGSLTKALEQLKDESARRNEGAQQELLQELQKQKQQFLQQSSEMQLRLQTIEQISSQKQQIIELQEKQLSIKQSEENTQQCVQLYKQQIDVLSQKLERQQQDNLKIMLKSNLLQENRQLQQENQNLTAVIEKLNMTAIRGFLDSDEEA